MNTPISTQEPVLLGTVHDALEAPKISKPISQHLSQKLHNPTSVNSITSNSISSQNPVTNNGGLSNLGNLISNSGNKGENSAQPQSSRENHPSNQGYQTSSPTIPTSNLGTSMINPGNTANPGKETRQSSQPISSTNLKPEQQIFGSISKDDNAKTEDYSRVTYGNDASVVITEKNIKSKNSLGRYSSTLTDVSPSATEFGTVIGGLRVNGQSKFDVIKPNNNSESENSNVRSKLRKRKQQTIQEP